VAPKTAAAALVSSSVLVDESGEAATPRVVQVHIMKRRTLSVTAALAAVLLLAACAASPNTLLGSPGPDGSVAGFWQGLWHGLIALFAFVVSLFRDDVGIYEAHNNGGWYDFGYVLGVLSAFGGGGGRARRRGRRQEPR
jgi:hypothetical protein